MDWRDLFESPADADRFVPGEPWHSLDGGKTWIPGPQPEPAEFANPRNPDLRVVSVDYERGEIVVGR